MGIIYEVERKFVFNRSLLGLFRSNQGNPQFYRLAHAKDYSFHDTYFDSSEILANKGIWIRKRDNQWEAKVNQRDSFTKAAYQETTSIPEIRDIVSKNVPDMATTNESGNFGLQAFCNFTTYRSDYVADDKFKIALDTTDFGHAVGEVEIMSADSENAEKDIDEFFARYSWFFERGKPKGKIGAYLELKKLGKIGKIEGRL